MKSCLGLFLASRVAAMMCFGYTITSKFDLDSIKGCTHISGNVEIDISDDVAIEFKNLESLYELHISGSGIKSINLPALERADGLFIKDTPNLSSLSLPLLYSSEEINLNGTGNLASVDFPGGLSTCGTLKLANTKIQSLTGFNAVFLDQLELQDNPNLQLVVPRLNTIRGNLTLKGNNGALFDAPGLTRVRGHITLANVSKVNLPLLNNVQKNFIIESFRGNKILIPIKTINGSLVVSGSQSLETLSLNRLETVERGISITNNSLLSLLRIQSLINCNYKFDIVSPKLKTIKINRNLKGLPYGVIDVESNCAVTKQGLAMQNKERYCTSALEKLVG